MKYVAIKPRAKRGLGILITTLLAVGLVACSPSQDGSKTTLNVMVPSLPSADAAFEKFNADFEAAHPDVTVNFTAVPTDTWNTTKAARLLAGDVDIFAPDLGLEPQSVFCQLEVGHLSAN